MNTLEFIYKQAGDADIADLVHLRLQFALELAGEQTEVQVQTLKQQLTTYFRSSTKDGTCISYIAMHHNEIAGIGTMHIRLMPGNFKNPSGKWGYLMNIYTVKKYRRQGVCKSIIEKLMAASMKAGVTAFELHATPMGAPVYTNMGFELHNEPTYRNYVTPTV